MGWVSEDVAAHEGYPAYVLRDGRFAGTSTARGVLPDPTAEVADAVPYSEVVAWQTRCVCGWAGQSWRRSDTTPGAYGGHDPDDALLGGRAVEELAHRDWLAHVAPLERAVVIRDAAAAFAVARRELDQAVWAARSGPDPLSWADIGQAVGMSRQAAHERWGQPARRVDSPGTLTGTGGEVRR
jgi:hypothetical protein